MLNVATGKAESLMDLIGYIEKVGQRKARLSFESERPGDIARSYARVHKIAHCLEFRAEVTLRQGIQSLL